ncbi:AAA family ATPase [Mesorhizobium sp. Cs1299R1N1]|uniref:AAA family ATPase n=1 Tax=Mesorhizobium sp. Cs1299R1N1 TaxID=3015172 RepID=UPI003FA583AD
MTKHPLEGVSLSVRNFKSFGDYMFQMLSFQPINILIGRNNAGKSSLIDLVDLFASEGKKYDGSKHNVRGRPYTPYLLQVIDENRFAGSFRKTLPEACFQPITGSMVSSFWAQSRSVRLVVDPLGSVP